MNPQKVALFHEHFPDPKTREQLHYAFAHQFLPLYVRKAPAQVFDLAAREPEGLTTFFQLRFAIHFVNAVFGRKPGMPELKIISDMKAKPASIAGFPAVILTMPTPPATACAYYVAFVQPNTNNNAAPANADSLLVFTLERSMMQGEKPIPDLSAPGMLGSWDAEGSHHNHGSVHPIGAGAFSAAIERALRASPAAG